MTDGAGQRRVAERNAWAHGARARSTASAAQAAQAAEAAAASSEHAERVITRLAERYPQHAEQLHAISSTAAGQRQATAARKDRFYAAHRAGGQRPAGRPDERPDEPGAAAFSALDAYLRDMAVVQERDRIAQELLDHVIRRVFAAGLTLQGTAGLAKIPEIRQRVEEAADELDEVIRAIRNTVFNLP